MPIYGLNCYSIIKHETLVLSRRALDALEKGIMTQLYRTDTLQKKFRYYEWKEKILAEGENEENSVWPPFV
uniref:Uncharacterized protein n=1 Tax=Acrobeloides nanus TaxID=290746 RepID=A0A914DIW1_9BILA